MVDLGLYFMLKKEGYTYEKNEPQKPWGCREKERELLFSKD